MNLVLLVPEDFIDGGRVARLDGRRRDHVLQIHRASEGDTLRVGVLGDRIGTGRILRLDERVLELDVALEQEPPPPLPIVLVLALPRPLVLKRVLLSATAFGVKQIVLLQTRRVERSFWGTTALREPALREHLLLGLEQARDTRLPEIRRCERFRPFVEDELPALCTGARAFVADPLGAVPCPSGVEGPVVLAVGPEGGFVPFELERLAAAGMQAVQLGERVLRVETAVPALLGRLS